MKIFIARQNIERFRRLLSESPDEASRKTILELLKAEEKKLADLQAESPPENEKDEG